MVDRHIFNNVLCKRSLMQCQCNIKAAAIPLFIELLRVCVLCVPSVRLSVRLTLSHRGKPPHREQSQLPIHAIDIYIYYTYICYRTLNIFNAYTLYRHIIFIVSYPILLSTIVYIIYHTHSLLCDILLRRARYYHDLYFVKTDIKSTENAKVRSIRCLYFVLKCEKSIKVWKDCQYSDNKMRK